MLILIMFRSLTYAQRSAHLLERAGITAAVTKAPQGTTAQGCTYCVRISGGKLHRTLDLLESNHVTHGRILQRLPDGSYRELAL